MHPLGFLLYFILFYILFLVRVVVFLSLSHTRSSLLSLFSFFLIYFSCFIKLFFLFCLSLSLVFSSAFFTENYLLFLLHIASSSLIAIKTTPT